MSSHDASADQRSHVHRNEPERTSDSKRPERRERSRSRERNRDRERSRSRSRGQDDKERKHSYSDRGKRRDEGEKRRHRSRSPVRERERGEGRLRSRSRSPARRRRRDASQDSSTGSSLDGRSRSRSRSRERGKERKHRHHKHGRSHRDREETKEERRERKERKRRKKEKSEGKNNYGGSSALGQWGKYGIINETDLLSKYAEEFRTWLVEERHINPETLSKVNERKEASRFVEDFNTATFTSDKYYNLNAHEQRMALIRSGETLPLADVYDPRADEAALKSSQRAARAAASSAIAEPVYHSKAQLEELRRVQNERIQAGKMKLMGQAPSATFGVRMDGSKFDRR